MPESTGPRPKLLDEKFLEKLLGVNPNQSLLSDESLEELLIALTKLKLKSGLALNIKPSDEFFTPRALTEWFGQSTLAGTL